MFRQRDLEFRRGPPTSIRGPLYIRPNVAGLLLEEAGHTSHVPLLPGLEEQIQ